MYSNTSYTVIHLHLVLAVCLLVSFHLQQSSVHIEIVCMACELMLWDFTLCRGIVELIATVQAQRIKNRKYSNSYTINFECNKQLSL
jgi:hypothetical protein